MNRLTATRCLWLLALLPWLVFPNTTRGQEPGPPPPKISAAKIDANGFLVHTVECAFQDRPTKIKVLLPDKLEKGRLYPVLYVLPVEAGDGSRFGDGLLEIKQFDLHNKYGLICVQPTFARLPWYADHPTDAKIRQESYFLEVVLPFIEKTYPVLAKMLGRRLLGFSKSGWGAFTADGETAATVGAGRIVRLWDTTSGREMRRWADEHDGFGAAAFSPDGRLFACTNSGRRPRVWETATGREHPAFGGHGDDIIALSFSADGKTLVSASAQRRHIRLWDVPTKIQRLVLSDPQAPLVHVTLSPDGKTLAGCRDYKEIVLWDAATGKELRRWSTQQEWVAALAFGLEGKTLLSAGGDGTLRCWDAATAAPVGMSKKIVIGRNATLLGPPPRSDTRGYFSPGAASAYVAFSTDGRRLAAVALEGGSWLGNRYEGGKYVVRLWDTATGRLRHEADAGDDCSPQFSAEGYTFLLNGPRGISVRETLTGLVRLSSRGSLGGYRAAVAPSGEVVAVHLRNPDGKAGKIHVQQTETGGELAQLPADHDATALAFSPAGNLLATGGTDGALLLWDGRGRWDRRPLPVAELSEEELVKLWSDLSGPDSGRAYQAMRRLLPAPRQAVSLLRKHIRTVTAAELRQMAQLIADLDNKSFQVRQRAAAQLERLGEVAEPLVRAALEGGPSLEARRRLEQLLPKVTNILASPARLGNARALEVLDRLGTAEARRLLEELARGAPEDWVTQEASASVRRLARGSPAP